HPSVLAMTSGMAMTSGDFAIESDDRSAGISDANLVPETRCASRSTHVVAAGAHTSGRVAVSGQPCSSSRSAWPEATCSTVTTLPHPAHVFLFDAENSAASVVVRLAFSLDDAIRSEGESGARTAGHAPRPPT